MPYMGSYELQLRRRVTKMLARLVEERYPGSDEVSEAAGADTRSLLPMTASRLAVLAF
jgi:hypothetical protein